jgi:hypothetical protein
MNTTDKDVGFQKTKQYSTNLLHYLTKKMTYKTIEWYVFTFKQYINIKLCLEFI